MADLPISRTYGVFQVCADPSSDTKISGILLPQLTTAQVDALVAQSPSVVDNGYVYYDTDKKGIYAYIDGTRKQLYTEVAPDQSFVLPSGTTSAMEIVANQLPGFLYYNTTNNNIRTYIAGTTNLWTTIFSSVTLPNSGTGLADGHTPLAIPSGVTAQVENNSATENHVSGFIYYDTTNQNIRIYTPGTPLVPWTTVFSSLALSDTGAGLDDGHTPLVIPWGDPAIVEAESATSNQFPGFIYYNTLDNNIRVRINNASGTNSWKTVTVS